MNTKIKGNFCIIHVNKRMFVNKQNNFSTFYKSHQENDHFCTTYKEVNKLNIILVQDTERKFCFNGFFFFRVSAKKKLQIKITDMLFCLLGCEFSSLLLI